MRSFYDRSMKKDIRRLFVWTIITSLLTVSLIIFYYWRISVNDMIVEMQAELSQSIHREIENFIAVPMQMNERNRYALEKGIIDLKSPEEMVRFFAGVMHGADETIYSFSFGTADGRYYGVRRNKENVLEFMRSDPSTKGESVYYALDEEDIPVYPVFSAGVFDVRQRDWFISAKTMQHPVFSPVYKHFVLQDLAVSAASPVYDRNGKFMGVLGTHSTLAKINKELRELLQEKQSVAYIVERNTGELIANTEAEPDFILLSENAVERVRIADIKNMAIRQGYEQYMKTGRKISDENGIYVNVSSFQQEGLDWLIITAVPEPASVGDIRRSIVLAVCLSLLLVLLEGYIWKKKIDHCLLPISDLVQITEKFSAGDFSCRAEVKEKNELAQLADAFNQMAVRIAGLIDGLEQKVFLRTQALEEKNKALLQAKAELEMALEIDFLTGLYNRKFLIQKMEKAIEAFATERKSFAVLMMDVDHFKRINDAYGHDCGDAVLKQLAVLMKNTFGDVGYTGRWGGEEFLAFLPDVDQKTAMSLAQKVCQEIRESIFPCGKEKIHLTMTMGAAVYEEEEILDAIIKKADIAVYYGKKNGRNQVVLFDPSMKE